MNIHELLEYAHAVKHTLKYITPPPLGEIRVAQPCSYRGPPVAAHDQSQKITKRHSFVRFKDRWAIVIVPKGGGLLGYNKSCPAIFCPF